MFRQIEYLHAVVETGSFAEAAEKCHVTQSAISQQIKTLEAKLGVTLLIRHNRTFSLTDAGEYFYKKTLILRSDLDKIIRETKRRDETDQADLRLAYFSGYHGDELMQAISIFSEKYPTVNIHTTSGSHEHIYELLRNDKVDVALNDQRRTFSNEYHNLILTTSTTHIEISTHDPLSNLDSIEVTDLKNIPCILVANEAERADEQKYLDEIVGLHGEFIYAASLQEARLMIATGQGYLPTDVLDTESWFDMAVKRLPLTRNGEPIKKAYCAFWKRDNSGYMVEEFTDILKSCF